MPLIHSYKWTISYVATIVFINWTVNGIPNINVLGAIVPPALFVAGLVFVLRDFSQRGIGQKVIVPTMLAAVLSYFIAGGWIALASALAFFISEAIDQIVFTVLRRPLKDRILVSSAISVPVDSLVFLYMIDLLSPAAFVVAFIAKMTASIIVWLWLNRRDGKRLVPAM